MSTFVDRLLEEKTQLDDRISKLNAFFMSNKYDDIEPIQKTLLSIQSQTMLTYSRILSERIMWLQSAPA